MLTTEDSLDRIESQHTDIIKRIDELDRQIEQVLEEWSNPAVSEHDIDKTIRINNRL